jgi:hypothetical protein
MDIRPKITPTAYFVVYREPESAGELGSVIKEKLGWRVSLPGYLDEAVLD